MRLLFEGGHYLRAVSIQRNTVVAWLVASLNVASNELHTTNFLVSLYYKQRARSKLAMRLGSSMVHAYLVG